MAYQSDESGQFDISVRPFPNVDGGFHAVSNAGGIFPVWSPDGRELFYLEPGPPARLMAVPLQRSATFTPGNPEVLFDWTYFTQNAVGGRTYDVSPDGQRFLVLRGGIGAGEDALSRQIITVTNWFEELKERAPVP